MAESVLNHTDTRRERNQVARIRAENRNVVTLAA
jgi:hypothetical protein